MYISFKNRNQINLSEELNGVYNDINMKEVKIIK